MAMAESNAYSKAIIWWMPELWTSHTSSYETGSQKFLY